VKAVRSVAYQVDHEKVYRSSAIAEILRNVLHCLEIVEDGYTDYGDDYYY